MELIAVLLFPASIKAFCDVEKSTREDKKDTTNKQDNKETNISKESSQP